MTERWFRFEFTDGDEWVVDLNTVKIEAVGKGVIRARPGQFKITIHRDTPYWAALVEADIYINLTENCYKELIRRLIRGY